MHSPEIVATIFWWSQFLFAGSIIGVWAYLMRSKVDVDRARIPSAAELSLRGQNAWRPSREAAGVYELDPPNDGGAEPRCSSRSQSAADRPPGQSRREPLRLTGIRIDGAPNEILGVSPRATHRQISTAYRDLMKRYHPDLVGRPGTRAWVDAQKIAEAINRARDSMLKQSANR